MIVDPDFPDHWKTRLLVNTLDGDEGAPCYVLRLWAHCQHRRAHTFPNLSAQALKALCRFPGHANKLESSLLTSGFIRRNGEALIVHQWEEYNSSLIANWENGKKGGRPKSIKTHGFPTANPNGTDREEKIDKSTSTHTAREGFRESPTLEVVKAHAHTAGIPEAVAEKFFHEAEARTFAPSGMWTLLSGQEMGNWQSALQAYWLGWQQRENQQRKQNGRTERPETRGGIATTAGDTIKHL